MSVGVEAQYLRADFQGNSILLDKPRWSLTFSNQLSLPCDFTIYANYDFTSSGDFHISSFEACHYLSFGISKTFFRGDLSVQLWAYDVLNGQAPNYVKYDSAILKHGSTDREMRQIALKIRYQFNATKSRYKGRGAGSSEKRRL